MEAEFIVHAGQYLGAGLCIGLGAIGAALGEGYTGGLANTSISRRPAMAPTYTRTMLVAQAVAETSAIFALMVSVLLLFTDLSGMGVCQWAAAIGAGLSMGLGAFGSGIGAGLPGGQAIWGLSRQPQTASHMTTTMLVSQAICQTPAIFSLVVAFLLIFKDASGYPLWPYSASFLAAGLAMGLGAIGSGWGGGMTGGACCEGFARQPRLRSQLMTMNLVGQAVSQTPAIFALLIAIMLVVGGKTEGNILTVATTLGAGLAIGFGAIGSGLGNGANAQGACEAVTMNSGTSKDMMTFMLVGQAIGQTPVIFALVVSLMLIFIPFSGMPANLVGFSALVGAGLSVGIAGIGSGFGNGLNGASACRGVALAPAERGSMLTLMLVGQAVAQTPAIFGLLVAFILMFKGYPGPATLPAAMALLSAGLCMGFGGLGPGVGNGFTGAAACEAAGHRPDQRGLIMRTMLVAQAVAQSTAIYALVIAFVLIFVV